MEAPIPPPRVDDDEDVHWALSTAGALWGRGESHEALKWLRRAAEQASEVQADQRSLELYKAAAELANLVASGPAPSHPEPPPSELAPSSTEEISAVMEIPPVQPPPMRPRAAPLPVKPQIPAAVAVQAGPRSAPRPSGSMVPAPSVGAPPRPPSVPAPGMHSSSLPAPLPRPGAGTSDPPTLAPALGRMGPPASVIHKPSGDNLTAGSAPPVGASAGKVTVPQAVAPKRRRSFTGESRITDETDKKVLALGRSHHPPSASEPPQKHQRRTTADEPVASHDDPSHVFDDLDEDTRVIDGHQPGEADAMEQGYEPVHAAHAAFVLSSKAPAQAAKPAANATYRPKQTDQPPALAACRPVHSDPVPAMHSSVNPASKRLDTLPALRVAVLATAVPGEVRLIKLGASENPPPGAAGAVLVPLTASDGEAVARLFGAIE